jgi:hypothetical protein
MVAAGEGDGRVDGDVGGEHPKGERDELLRAPFGGLGVDAGGGEPPEHDDPGERLDQRVGTEGDERDRAGDGASGDRDGRLDPVPDQAAAGEQPGAGDEPVAPAIVPGAGLRRGAGVDDGQLDGHPDQYVEPAARFLTRWPALGSCPLAVRWLVLQQDLGRSPRTLEAYARSLVDYLGFCERHRIDIGGAGRAEIAGYVRDLRERLAGMART